MKLKSPDKQKAPAAQVAACQFGPGHDWLEITTTSDLHPEYVCGNCGALADASDSYQTDHLPPWAKRDGFG
jgi:hypothetical protein